MSDRHKELHEELDTLREENALFRQELKWWVYYSHRASIDEINRHYSISCDILNDNKEQP